MNSQVFREYDIRGIVENDFDDEFVVDLGRGYATLLHHAGKKTITLGRDCRLSSDRLRDRLAEGLLGAGINVVDIGVVPTPLLYFSVLHWKMDGGAMITGSHNAAEYNGFKLGRRADDDLRRRDSAAARNNRAARFRHDRREGLADRASGDSRLQRFHHVAVQAHAGDEGRRRRRQRMRRRGRGAADEAARARHDRALHRDGRALPEPSSGPDGRGEHARSDRGGENQSRGDRNRVRRRRRSRSARWTRTGKSCGATS